MTGPVPVDECCYGTIVRTRFSESYDRPESNLRRVQDLDFREIRATTCGQSCYEDTGDHATTNSGNCTHNLISSTCITMRDSTDVMADRFEFLIAQ